MLGKHGGDVCKPVNSRRFIKSRKCQICDFYLVYRVKTFPTINFWKLPHLQAKDVGRCRVQPITRFNT